MLDEPILTSAEFGGQVAPFLRADLFAGPVTFLPAVADRYTMFVPLHAGALPAQRCFDGTWQDVRSAAPKVHLQQPEDHVGWRWGRDARLLRLEIDPLGVQRFLSSELRLVGSDSRIAGLTELSDPEICRTASMLADVLADARPGQTVLFDAIAQMFVVHMARSYLVATAVGQGGLSGEQLSEILVHIDARLSEPIRIHDLADLVHMSESAFLRAVKAATGETPHELLRRRRLNEASRLLREDILSLGQIASVTGFADQAHLSRSFKREFGVSPSHWRRS